MKPNAVVCLAVLVVPPLLAAAPVAAQSSRTQAAPASTQPIAAPGGAPAQSADGLRLGPDDLARATARLQQAPATRIYRSVLPDGRVVLSDVPVPSARSVESRAYALPAPSEAQSRASAERAYWRQQAEAFEQRRQERLARRDRELDIAVIVDADQRHRALAASAPPAFLVSPSAVPPVYASSPGAAQGRTAPFIGSGFSRAGQ